MRDCPVWKKDLIDKLDKMVPCDDIYAHAHFLPSYGATGEIPRAYQIHAGGQPLYTSREGTEIWFWDMHRISILPNLTVSRTENITFRLWVNKSDGRPKQGDGKMRVAGSREITVWMFTIH